MPFQNFRMLTDHLGDIEFGVLQHEGEIGQQQHGLIHTRRIHIRDELIALVVLQLCQIGIEDRAFFARQTVGLQHNGHVLDARLYQAFRQKARGRHMNVAVDDSHTAKRGS